MFYKGAWLKRSLAVFSVVLLVGIAIVVVNSAVYRADEPTATSLPAASDLLKIKNNAIQLRSELTNNLTGTVLAGTPSYFIAPSPTTQAEAEQYLAKRQIDKLDIVINSISDKGEVVTPSTNLVNVKTILYQIQKEVLEAAGAPNTRERLAAFLARKDLDAKQEAMTELGQKVNTTIQNIKDEEKKMADGTVTQEEAKQMIQKQTALLMDDMDDVQPSALPGSDESKGIAGLKYDLRLVADSLYKPPVPSLWTSKEEKAIDAILGEIGKYTPMIGSTYGSSTETASKNETAQAAIEKELSKLTPQQLAERASMAGRFVKIDANNDGSLDNWKANLGDDTRLRASRICYYYLQSIKGLPELGGLSADAMADFLYDNAWDVMGVANNKIYMTENPNAKDLIAARQDLNAQRSRLIVNYRKYLDQYEQQKSLQPLYAAVHDVLGTDQPTMAIFHQFQNNNKISYQGMLTMFSVFGDDKAKITAFMKSGKNVLYTPTGEAITVNWSDNSEFINYFNLPDGKLAKDFYTPDEWAKKQGGKTAVAEAGGIGLTEEEIKILNDVEVALNAQTQSKAEQGKAGLTPTKPGAAVQGLDMEALKYAMKLPNGKLVDSRNTAAVKEALTECYIDYALAYGYDKSTKEFLIKYFGQVDDPFLLSAYAEFLDMAANNSSSIYGLMNSLKLGTEQLNLVKKAYKTGLAINPKTGNVEYTTAIKHRTDLGRLETVGYMSFDPVAGTFDAQLPAATYKDKQVTFYSDPRVGDVYVEFRNRRQDATGGEIPLYKFKNNIQLMSVTVAKDGSLGGTFKLFNRLFNYNPNSKTFEMPISLGNGQQIWIDTKGNMRGQVTIAAGGANTASVYFDRTGDIGLSYEIKSGEIVTSNGVRTGERYALGTVTINKSGQIAGAADLGKIISGKDGHSFFIGIDKSGITGINVPLASVGGNPFGLGVGKDGSLSFGGYVPIAGLPVPLGIGQDAHGNFRLSFPGGSLKLGHEDRALTPPAPEIDEQTGNYKAECVYFKHKVRKWLKAIYVYQDCGKMDETEQMERGAMIFQAYNDIIKRNPTLDELMNWYYYGGHETYGDDDHMSKEKRMKETKERLTKKLNGSKEYKWIKDGNKPEDYPKRPQYILESNPFTNGAITKAQTENPVDEVSQENMAAQGDGTTDYADWDAFAKQVVAAAKSDPYFMDYLQKMTK